MRKKLSLLLILSIGLSSMFSCSSPLSDTGGSGNTISNDAKTGGNSQIGSIDSGVDSTSNTSASKNTIKDKFPPLKDEPPDFLGKEIEYSWYERSSIPFTYGVNTSNFYLSIVFKITKTQKVTLENNLIHVITNYKRELDPVETLTYFKNETLNHPNPDKTDYLNPKLTYEDNARVADFSSIGTNGTLGGYKSKCKLIYDNGKFIIDISSMEMNRKKANLDNSEKTTINIADYTYNIKADFTIPMNIVREMVHYLYSGISKSLKDFTDTSTSNFRGVLNDSGLRYGYEIGYRANFLKVAENKYLDKSDLLSITEQKRIVDESVSATNRTHFTIKDSYRLLSPIEKGLLGFSTCEYSPKSKQINCTYPGLIEDSKYYLGKGLEILNNKKVLIVNSFEYNINENYNVQKTFEGYHSDGETYSGNFLKNYKEDMTNFLLNSQIDYTFTEVNYGSYLGKGSQKISGIINSKNNVDLNITQTQKTDCQQSSCSNNGFWLGADKARTFNKTITDTRALSLSLDYPPFTYNEHYSIPAHYDVANYNNIFDGLSISTPRKDLYLDNIIFNIEIPFKLDDLVEEDEYSMKGNLNNPFVQFNKYLLFKQGVDYRDYIPNDFTVK